MHRITGVIRDYDWGDHRAIASILGHDAPGHPEAEYWLGAHPSAPSAVDDGQQALDDLIEAGGPNALGAAVFERFGRLPFLLKILAAAGPLSIQAHPSLEQAKAGFAREDAAGIDRAAPNRNYRDDNHKPELICAITPFEAKCGFRAVAETRELLGLFSGAHVSRLVGLLDGDDEAAGLAAAVQWLLQLEAGEAGGFADDIVEQAKQLQAVPASERFGREIEWTVKIGTGFPGDIGVVVGLLLNHVSLLPGQAMFLEAGNLHSYLQGTGIELMANSDNVLRGGLTPKHVDVDELLAVVQYAPSAAPVQTPDGPVHRFESPVPEFNLTRLGPSATGQSFGTAPFGPDGPSIVLLTGGQVSLETGSQTLALGAGDTAFVTAADGPFRLVDGDPGVTTAWVATVGDGR